MTDKPEARAREVLREIVGEDMRNDARIDFETAIRAMLAFASTNAGEVQLRESIKPWADYHGDLPDFDHPLRCVFESGVQFTVELLAKELGVENWDTCDGTEEFEGDLGGTLINIIHASGSADEHGDYVPPRELAAALVAKPLSAEQDGAGWIIGSGDGLRFRAWIDGIPAWVENPDDATRYARRKDAEDVHQEDEDAWRVVPFVIGIQRERESRECPHSPNGRHQVDTSMESGPNNCFHCDQPMRAADVASAADPREGKGSV